MSKELLYGLGGVIIGAIGSNVLQACPECISTPLLNPKITPVINPNEFSKDTTFPVGSTDLIWTAYSLTDNVYGYLIYVYTYFNQPTVNSRIEAYVFDNTKKIIDFNVSELHNLVIDDQPNALRMMYDEGSILYDKTTLGTTLNLQVPGYLFHFEHIGHPFKYDLGDVAVVIPGKYMKGFELIGYATGKINNTINLAGYAVSERMTRTQGLDEYPYRWFSCSDEVNKFYCIVLDVLSYKDAGFWYNGKYYKPYDIQINNINTITDTSGTVWSADKNIKMFIRDDDLNGVIDITSQLIGNYTREKSHFFIAYYNGLEIARGMAGDESVP